MESVIDQALGEVHGLDAILRLQFVAEDDFMHGRRRVRQVVNAFQSLADVIRVEHRVFRSLPQAVRTVGEDVGQRADEHSEVSVKGAHAADGVRAVVVEAERAVGAGDDDRCGKERLEDFFAGDGAGAGATASVRRGEGFVQVEVHHVDAEVAGARLAYERVHVGAVHVEQRAFGVQDVGDAVNLALEDADGGGVGEHERGGVLVHHAGEFREVHHALRVRLEVGHLIAADRGGGGVGAVRRVRDQDLLARVALALVIRADKQDAGELAVRAGGGLQRDGVHAGDLDEAVLQELHDAEATLRQRLRLIGVRVGDAIERRDRLVHARVVLHGATAQRIHAEVDGVVPGGEAGEVANDLDLR